MERSEIINISYGKGFVPLIADPSIADWHIIKPRHEVPLDNPCEAFRVACQKPIGSPPLAEIIKPGDRIVIVTSDGTRPVPNKKLISWLLELLSVPSEKIKILLGNGTHRKNTEIEIREMFGEEITGRFDILNHDSNDLEQLVCVGETNSRGSVYVNRHYLEADRRIVLGFIEPHLFAGFSGGAKGIFPGIAGLETILHLHRAQLIAHPMSTWGKLDENPIQQEIAEMASLCPPDFLINVTLNAEKEITGIYAGHYQQAHRSGCDGVKKISMVSINHKYPIVITSNSGFPLDQNLYQSVKGISAAARIVKEGGTIFVAAECSDGIPSHGNFAELMKRGSTPDDVLQSIFKNERTALDQWSAQILSTILKRAKVALFSSLPPEQAEVCKVEPIGELQSAVYCQIHLLGGNVDVAVMPDGPLTIPFLTAGF